MSELRVIPLGGADEIGKNCTAVMQGDDLIVVDVGLSFPNEEMLGVDIVIPDFSFLVENRDKLRGVFLTHAHEDHVGALPYLLAQVKCPVYATEFTHAMIRSKLDEKLDTRALELKTMRYGETIQVGSLTVEPVRVTHSIPDTSSLAIGTAHGYILFTSDFKFDFTPVDNKLSDIGRLTELGREGVLLLMSDSTNVERPGWGPSEREVADGLRKAFLHAPGRVFLTTFASNVHRIQQVFDVAHETGRKVACAGRRMEQVIDTCVRLGYMKIERGTRIKLDEVGSYPPEQIAIVTTGSQGEPMSALVQMSKEEYSRMKVLPGDTILYSARPIPGNEAAIWRTINRLFRMGATVVYESPTPIHVSGHAYQEELKMMINLTRPYYIAPVHGEPRHQHIFEQMALAMGYPEHRVFTLTDGQSLCMDETSAWLGEPVACGRVLVDNGGNAGIPDEVLRDRHSLANDGIVVLTIAVDVERGEIVGEPEVQAKGYSGPPKALEQAAKVLEDALASLDKSDIQDIDEVRRAAGDAVRRFLHRGTQLRPLVVPAIIEV